MIQLQYWNGTEWIDIGEPWIHEFIAWASLGGDDINYRTINTETGKVLTDKKCPCNSMKSLNSGMKCSNCGREL